MQEIMSVQIVIDIKWYNIHTHVVNTEITNAQVTVDLSWCSFYWIFRIMSSTSQESAAFREIARTFERSNWSGTLHQVLAYWMIFWKAAAQLGRYSRKSCSTRSRTGFRINRKNYKKTYWHSCETQMINIQTVRTWTATSRAVTEVGPTRFWIKWAVQMPIWLAATFRSSSKLQSSF